MLDGTKQREPAKASRQDGTCKTCIRQALRRDACGFHFHSEVSPAFLLSKLVSCSQANAVPVYMFHTLKTVDGNFVAPPRALLLVLPFPLPPPSGHMLECLIGQLPNYPTTQLPNYSITH